MITAGTTAIDFAKEDQFGKVHQLGKELRKHNVLLLFYPADWTPTCSQEVPELDALADQFLAANTTVMAISTDSRFCHSAWAATNGGVTMPILADVTPLGSVSQAYGAWIPNEQLSDRATVIIDQQGKVRYAVSVGKDGRRDMDQLLAIASGIAGRAGHAAVTKPELYVSVLCGHCKHVVQALHNLHAESQVRVIYTDNNPSAQKHLREVTRGRAVTPSLVAPDGQIYYGSPDIIDYLMQHLSAG